MTTIDTPKSSPQPTVDRVFTLPDLGEGLVSAEIVSWLVDVGAEVTTDQAVVVVDTAKSVVDLPVPFAGTVVQRHGEPGDVVDIGQPLVTVRADGNEPEPVSAHLVGQPHKATATAPDKPRTRLPRRPDRNRNAASPAVRRLARDLGIGLDDVTGTGRGGTITSDDIHQAARSSGESD